MRGKNGLLMEEFNVQVFADGRVDWDRLDAYLLKNLPACRRLALKVGKRLFRAAPQGALRGIQA